MTSWWKSVLKVHTRMTMFDDFAISLTFDIKAQVRSLTLTINETTIKLTVNFQCLSDL